MTLYRKTLFILISGKAGVGKTTTKDILSNLIKDAGFEVYTDSFASGVKQVARYLGWDGNKDSRGRSLLQKIGQLGRDYNEDIWVKQLYGRTIVGADSIFPPDVIIVDDWRFPNELEYIKEQARNMGMITPITVRIEAPEREILKGTKEYVEVSETSLPSMVTENFQYNSEGSYNYTIFNLGTMQDLEDKTKLLYENLKNLREIINE